MNKTLAQIRRLYDLFDKALSSLQSPFLAAIRVYWGWQIAQNGWGKLHNLGNVTQFFGSLGLPAPSAAATFVASFEFAGGILLAVGLLSRIAALGLVIDMTTAYIVADRQAFLSFFSDPNKFAAADPFVFFFVGLLILILGPGKISVDAFSQHIFRKRAPHVGSSVPA
jgi:putative oxidoreductase